MTDKPTGQRNISIQGSTDGSILIPGDGNTVNVYQSQQSASHKSARALELAYLTKLRQTELAFIDRYTPVSGDSQRRVRLRIACSLEPAGRDTPPQPW